MIDMNEAPEGYIAVSQPFPGCSECSFYYEQADCEGPISCLAYERKDGHNVIFIKRD